MRVLALLTGAWRTQLHRQSPLHGGSSHSAISAAPCSAPQEVSSPLAIVCCLYNLGQDLVNLVTFLISFLGLRSLLLPSRREFPFTGNSHTAGMRSRVTKSS